MADVNKSGFCSVVKREETDFISNIAPRDEHNTCRETWTQCVNQLIEEGVNSRNIKKARRAMIIAAEKGFAELVQTLIEAGADVNVSDNNGRTPLMFAVYIIMINV